jgi:hypothetical protein
VAQPVRQPVLAQCRNDLRPAAKIAIELRQGGDLHHSIIPESNSTSEPRFDGGGDRLDKKIDDKKMKKIYLAFGQRLSKPIDSDYDSFSISSPFFVINLLSKVLMPIKLQSELRRVSQAEFGEITYEVMEVVFAVHNELGRFLEEDIYRRAIAQRDRVQNHGYAPQRLSHF